MRTRLFVASLVVSAVSLGTAPAAHAKHPAKAEAALGADRRQPDDRKPEKSKVDRPKGAGPAADEIGELRRQVAALQQRLDAMSGADGRAKAGGAPGKGHGADERKQSKLDKHAQPLAPAAAARKLKPKEKAALLKQQQAGNKKDARAGGAHLPPGQLKKLQKAGLVQLSKATTKANARKHDADDNRDEHTSRAKGKHGAAAKTRQKDMQKRD